MPSDHRGTSTPARPANADSNGAARQAHERALSRQAHDAGEGDDAWMYEPLEVSEGRMTFPELVMGALCVAALAGMLLYVLLETGLLAGLIVALSIAR